jgi:hypothetical protein
MTVEHLQKEEAREGNDFGDLEMHIMNFTFELLIVCGPLPLGLVPLLSLEMKPTQKLLL